MVTLHNVIDTRTGTFYAEAIVSDKNQKYFVKREVAENE